MTTISEAKIHELESYGTTGSTIMMKTLSLTLVIALHSAFSVENAESRMQPAGTKGTLSDIPGLADRSIILDWRRTLCDQLVNVCQEASVRGWDGYGAEPITKVAVNAARYVIDLLPETMPLPDIVPSPNGEIAFEWDRGKDYLFSIRTHGKLLVYAGLFGSDRKQYGQEPIDKELPLSVSTILATYFSRA